MNTTTSRLRRWAGAVVIASLLAAGLVATQQAAPAQALSGSQFDPGNIISDQFFYDSNAMSEAEIQAFLNAKIGSCSNSNCLNVLRVATVTKAARYTDSGYLVCKQYTGSANESAASIIFKVQQACSISAKVILVTLQKEQSLVTQSSVSLSTLERAMGYGCPDNTGGTCASAYYGFFNQVYAGAWQLKRYSTVPAWGTFQPGVRTVTYKPNTTCGGTAVNIINNATAALYNYTPYQPNPAALANLRGTGDACSSYGNRNFWVYYNDWFGSSTLPPGSPEGNLDSVTTSSAGVTVSGWAVDPDAVTGSVVLSIQLGSTWQVLTANKAGDDLSARYAGAGKNHAFSGTLPIGAGTHTMCLYLVNAGGVGSTGTLGCRTVTVPLPPAPVGALQTVTSSGESISFSGWAVRPDALTSPVSIAVNVGASWSAFTADKSNTAAPGQVTGAGPNQGFSGSVSAAPGVQNVCIWAAPTSGPATNIGCRSVVVTAAARAVAKIESTTADASTVTVSGYSVWPQDLAAAVPVAVNIGANWFALAANATSATGAAAVSGAGDKHGYTGTYQLPAGVHTVCVWTAEKSGGSTLLGCNNVTVGAVASPIRSELQSVGNSANAVTFAGWSAWTASPGASVPIAVNIGAQWFAFSANQPNPAAEAAVPGIGANHGFAGSIPMPPGRYDVCVWAGLPAGGSASLGCGVTTVAAGLAVLGEVTTVSSGVGGVHIDGWAARPDALGTPVSIAANIGAQWIPLSANKPNSVAPTRLSGAGANQGYSALIPAAAGAQSVCVWATGATGNVNLGCKSTVVTTPPGIVGGISAAAGVAGGIEVKGWAVWPSALTTPVAIAANVGSTWVAIPANVPSTMTADYVLGAGPNQGFSSIVAAPKGTQTICIWGTHPTDAAVNLGCSVVVVP